MWPVLLICPSPRDQGSDLRRRAGKKTGEEQKELSCQQRHWWLNVCQPQLVFGLAGQDHQPAGPRCHWVGTCEAIHACSRGCHNPPAVQDPRARRPRRHEDAKSASQTKPIQKSEVGVILAGKPRGAVGTNARKMGEHQTAGRLGRCQGAGCEGVGGGCDSSQEPALPSPRRSNP